VKRLNNFVKKEDLMVFLFCNIDIVYLYCYNEEVNRINRGTLYGDFNAVHRSRNFSFFCLSVYKDAKARGNDAAIFWAIATFLAWIIVLLSIGSRYERLRAKM
jgi:hypothetical protein